MREKIFPLLLAMLSLFALASEESSLTWNLTHKMEFTLLLVAAVVLALCFSVRAQADNHPNEFQTLRFLVQHLVVMNTKQILIGVTVIVELI